MQKIRHENNSKTGQVSDQVPEPRRVPKQSHLATHLRLDTVTHKLRCSTLDPNPGLRYSFIRG